MAAVLSAIVRRHVGFVHYSKVHCTGVRRRTRLGSRSRALRVLSVYSTSLRLLQIVHGPTSRGAGPCLGAWVLIEASPLRVVVRFCLKLNRTFELSAPLGPPPGLAVARAVFSFFFLPSWFKLSFIQLCVAHIAHWSRARPFMLHRYRHFYCVALYCATLQRRESVS